LLLAFEHTSIEPEATVVADHTYIGIFLAIIRFLSIVDTVVVSFDDWVLGLLARKDVVNRLKVAYYLLRRGGYTKSRD
jgi:hypothetical protein